MYKRQVSGQFLLDSEASLAGLDVRGIDEVPTAAGASEAQDDADEPRTYRASGTIERITARNITLRHGPVAALEWPAMTMTFATEGAAQVRGFKRGDRVSFQFVQGTDGPRLTGIRKAGDQ